MRIRLPGSKSQIESVRPVSPSRAGPVEEDRLETTDSTRPTRDTSPIPGTAITSTWASRAWVRILPSLVLLAIILLFAFQNLGDTKITFVTWSGTVPLALALFVAAALGGLLVLALGSIRIVQLRKVIHSYKSSGTTKGESVAKPEATETQM